jgi:hypothetical protein
MSRSSSHTNDTFKDKYVVISEINGVPKKEVINTYSVHSAINSLERTKGRILAVYKAEDELLIFGLTTKKPPEPKGKKKKKQPEISGRKLISYKRAEKVCRELRHQYLNEYYRRDEDKLICMLDSWADVTGRMRDKRP